MCLHVVLFLGGQRSSYRQTLVRNEVSGDRIPDEPARAVHGQLVPVRLALQTVHKPGTAVLFS